MKESTRDKRSWMTAITFAEAGEWESARQYMPRPRRPRVSRLSRLFMAVTFAEAGLHEEALRHLGAERGPGSGANDLLANLGLRGVRMTYGVVAAESAA